MDDPEKDSAWSVVTDINLTTLSFATAHRKNRIESFTFYQRERNSVSWVPKEYTIKAWEGDITLENFETFDAKSRLGEVLNLPEDLRRICHWKNVFAVILAIFYTFFQ